MWEWVKYVANVASWSLLGFFVGMNACTFGPLEVCHANPGLRYEVEISPAFTGAEQVDIIKAVGDWQDAIGPRLQISYVILSTPDQCTREDGIMCVTPNFEGIDDAGGGVLGLDHTDTCQGSDIQIWVNRYSWLGGDMPFDSFIEQIAEHEIGHGMGLGHIVGKNIMNGDFNQQSHLPTPQDVAEFWSLR